MCLRIVWLNMTLRKCLFVFQIKYTQAIRCFIKYLLNDSYTFLLYIYSCYSFTIFVVQWLVDLFLWCRYLRVSGFNYRSSPCRKTNFSSYLVSGIFVVGTVAISHSNNTNILLTLRSEQRMM